ncbi:TonB-dependent receptor [Frateuria sp. GZRR35]
MLGATLALAPLYGSAQDAGPLPATSQAPEAKSAEATNTPTLGTVIVLGRRENLVGETISASEGSVGRDEIMGRPSGRTGDLLEFVPGLVVTQHSGSGKANQYFLRGFNLDHGTDFATFVDGMPVNLRTHAHGQGYTDLNFLIPETVQSLAYRKGNYYADVGDFSSAGTARFTLLDRVPRGTAELAGGSYGYARGLLLDSKRVGAGHLLYALEAQRYDGPWTGLSEDVRKLSLLLRASGPVGSGQGQVTLMGYRNRWNSPDQIPQRAVSAGLIDAFGQIDPGDGGNTSRASLSAGWKGMAWGGDFAASAYAVDYRLRLWSDFTYLLDDPVHGDQFEQVDRRQIYGFDLSQQWQRGRDHWRIGAQGRYDDIDEVGLFHTQRRQVLGTVRDDTVGEGSLGVYAANEFRFDDRLRVYLGARYDGYRFRVDSSLPANSGHAAAGIASYKASLVYRPWKPLELYASWGTGFHSNDARGTTIAVDPNTGEPASRVTPLVGSRGAELGSRAFLGQRFNATLAVWALSPDSELLFTGDGGTTEPSRPARRHGIELALNWFPTEHLSADLEASWSRARFTDPDPAGPHIPGAIPLVISADVVARSAGGWLASARLRHFGPYPLVEDGSVRSHGSTLLNLRVGRKWGRWGAYLDLLNALDSHDHDIDYWFASRLQGEAPQGVEDVHFHIFEPRSLRLSLRYRF